ncbi:MAG: putative metal-binding motif-containing protein [Myxococcota bacterium]
MAAATVAGCGHPDCDVERCDGVDNDCDGAVDELDPSAADGVDAWPDGDGDGYGAFGAASRVCAVPAGSAAIDGDCADDDDAIHPGVAERCDGIDQDCDGLLDDAPDVTWYADLDGDGYGDPAAPTASCDGWSVADATDCDDADAARHPGAPEVCGGVADDCDGAVDSDDPDVVPDPWFVDADRDGVGGALPAGEGCAPPAGISAATGDCDDDDPVRFPGAVEACDGIDQDCDLVVDGPGAWAFPELAVRIPVTVEATVRAPGPIPIDVDFAAALAAVGEVEPFDPASLRAAIHDCGGPLGSTALPVTFLDDAVDLGAAGAHDDPVGDGHGAVVVLWDTDGDAATSESIPAHPVELGLYFVGDAPETPFASDLAATDTTLAAGAIAAAFAPASGGLLRELTRDGGPSVADQARATNGNGVHTPAGPLAAQDLAGTAVLRDSSPVTAAVEASGHLENASGGFDYRYTYRAFAGQDELWVTTRFHTTAQTQVDGDPDRTTVMRPFQSRWTIDATCTTDPGLRWVDGSNGATGLTWVWAAPPTYVTDLSCDAGETWTAANDYRPCCYGPTGAITTDTSWVDEPVLVLLPHGADPIDDLRDARLAGTPVTVGAAERR